MRYVQLFYMTGRIIQVDDLKNLFEEEGSGGTIGEGLLRFNPNTQSMNMNLENMHSAKHQAEFL